MRLMRCAVATVFVAVMFLLAQITGNDMFVFPEMFALLIGMVCADKMPWKTDGVHSVIMMTLSAIIGVCIVLAIPLPMYFQALIGLAAVGLLITLGDCSLMPCIAACLFPIYFKESSLMYPTVVAVMTFFVVRIRAFFVSKGAIESNTKFRYLPDFEFDLKVWLGIVLIFAVLAIIPMFTGYVLFLAPPVAVTLAEGSAKQLKGKRVKIWFVITVAAVIGSLARYVTTDVPGIPMFVAGFAAAVTVLIEMRLMNMMFPPAGAVVLLAFLADGNVFLYPPMISIGTAAVLALSGILNRKVGN